MQGLSKQTCNQETVKITLRVGDTGKNKTQKFHTLKGIKIKMKNINIRVGG